MKGVWYPIQPTTAHSCCWIALSVCSILWLIAFFPYPLFFLTDTVSLFFFLFRPRCSQVIRIYSEYVRSIIHHLGIHIALSSYYIKLHLMPSTYRCMIHIVLLVWFGSVWLRRLFVLRVFCVPHTNHVMLHTGSDKGEDGGKLAGCSPGG